MHKIIRITAIMTLLLLALTACNDTITASTESTRKPVVYASFYPMYDFAKKASGELADVRLLIPDGTEPHDWEPNPRDIAELEKADLFVYSNRHFETWAETLLQGINNENLMAVETYADELRFEDDPHIWLYPRAAKLQFVEICSALQRIDPDNADKYAENEAFWSEEFDKLDREFSEFRRLFQGKQNKILVTHGAFNYLCGMYGLEQITIIDGSPDLEPDPARMAEMVKIAREYGITTVFYEEISGARIAQVIANEIGGKTAPLSPLEGLSDSQRQNGGDYFSVMRENLAALKEALA